MSIKLLSNIGKSFKNIDYYFEFPDPLVSHISKDKNFKQSVESLIYYKVKNKQHINEIKLSNYIYGFKLNENIYSKTPAYDKIVKLKYNKKVDLPNFSIFSIDFNKQFPGYGGYEVEIADTGNVIGMIDNFEIIGDITLLASKEWQVIGKQVGNIYANPKKTQIIKDIKYVFTKEDYTITHLSTKEIKSVHNSKNINKLYEPKGLYYSTRFVRFLEGDFSEQYLYGIRLVDAKNSYTKLEDPDKNKILLLSTKKDYKQFLEKYGVYDRTYKEYLYKWLDVSNDFGGIQWEGDVMNFAWKLPGYGCIWRKDLVKNVVLIARRTETDWLIRDKLQPVVLRMK